jgi:hypothetical protein
VEGRAKVEGNWHVSPGRPDHPACDPGAPETIRPDPLVCPAGAPTVWLKTKSNERNERKGPHSWFPCCPCVPCFTRENTGSGGLL